MSPGGYSIEITGLSPQATENDVYDFFAFCGTIEHVDIVRAGEYACSAYVTFKEAYALESALLFSGATIVDQCICVTRWGQCEDEFDYWNLSSWKLEDASSSRLLEEHQSVCSSGDAMAMAMAEDAVTTILARGCTLGKDALTKARSLDDSHQVSASAAAAVAKLCEKIGLADKICAGVEAVKSIDERYHISDATKSAAYVTRKAAAAAANAVVNSCYLSKGACWVSDMLNHASEVTAYLGGPRAKTEKLA
ncbi:hypothetical protein NMG60_11036300 [Bertholletia excelsa]